jgi:hypothetical protein
MGTGIEIKDEGLINKELGATADMVGGQGRPIRLRGGGLPGRVRGRNNRRHIQGDEDRSQDRKEPENRRGAARRVLSFFQRNDLR